MNKNKQYTLLLAFLKKLDLALTYKLLALKWLEHNTLTSIHKETYTGLDIKRIYLDVNKPLDNPENYLDGYYLNSVYPSMFLEVKTNLNQGLLTEEKMKTFFNNNCLTEQKYFIWNEISDCIQYFLFDHFFNQLKKTGLIPQTYNQDINNCFNQFDKYKMFDDLYFHKYNDEMYVLDCWSNLSLQTKNYLLALSYGVVDGEKLRNGKINTNMFSIYQNMFSIYQKNSDLKYLKICSNTINFLIQNIDLLVLHYEDFDKEEALKTYKFILELIA